MTAPTTSPERARLLSRGLRLEYLTVGWNVAAGSDAEIGTCTHVPAARAMGGSGLRFGPTQQAVGAPDRLETCGYLPWIPVDPCGRSGRMGDSAKGAADAGY